MATTDVTDCLGISAGTTQRLPRGEGRHPGRHADRSHPVRRPGADRHRHAVQHRIRGGPGHPDAKPLQRDGYRRRDCARVSDVTRDSATVATLTLAYSGEDITTAGTLSVTLAAAGHTGTDDLMTGTIAITASTGANVCGRTAQVRDAIVRQSSATECTSITDLATITRLNLQLQRHRFAAKRRFCRLVGAAAVGFG